jgi:hypothetical protein
MGCACGEVTAYVVLRFMMDGCSRSGKDQENVLSRTSLRSTCGQSAGLFKFHFLSRSLTVPSTTVHT